MVGGSLWHWHWHWHSPPWATPPQHGGQPLENTLTIWANASGLCTTTQRRMQRDRREQGLAGFAGLAAFYAGVQPAPGQSSDGRARRRGVCMHQNRSASRFAPPCKARHAATTHATGLRRGAPYKRLTAQLPLFLARIAACVCLHYWPCLGLESVQKTTQSPLSSAIPSTSHGPLLFHCPADHSSTSSAGPRLLACDRHSALQSLIDSRLDSSLPSPWSAT